MNIERQPVKKVAFLGPKGSYSHAAVLQYLARSSCPVVERECLTFIDVLREVENGLSDCALLPVENTSSGIIHDVYDLIQRTSLHVVDELRVFIEHCVLVAVNTDLHKIKTVYSHPEPFRQCSFFIRSLPHWEIEYTASTAVAMEKVAKLSSPYVAALGSETGGLHYQLNVLARDISDKRENSTRFVVLSCGKPNGGKKWGQ